MERFFSQDNPIMVFLGKLFDVMLLSLIWFLFSIPLLTIGASTTALYYASVKSIRRDRGYIFREFWHCFKTNFIQATILWILGVIIVILMFTNIQLALSIGGVVGTVLTGVYAALSFILLGMSMYILPFLSRFTMKTFPLLKTCLFVMFRHLLSTIAIVVIFLGSIFVASVILPLLFIIPSAGAIGISLLMERILKKYTPEPDKEYSENGELLEDRIPWYLE